MKRCLILWVKPRKCRTILLIAAFPILSVVWIAWKYVLVGNSKWENEPDANLVIYTRIAAISGGDAKPDPQPWTLPNVIVHENLRHFVDDLRIESAGNFVTSNFFISPGLGNLMFLYATMYAISRQKQMQLIVPEGLLLRRSFYLSTNKNNSDIYVSDRLAHYFLKQWKRHTFHDCCKFYPEVLQINESANGTLVLLGYFQSFKYFHKYATEIRSKFEFLDDVRILASRTIEQALKASGRLKQKTVLIGVHVRRGVDLSWNTRNKVHGHTIAPKNYFLKAIDFYRRQNNGSHSALFLVVSDDSYWCKQNLLQKNRPRNTVTAIDDKKDKNENKSDIVIVASGQKTREVDLAVLANCQHTIMSTGTFSWWAAYLAGGQAVYYEYWPRPGSSIERMLNKSDYFLPEWKGMM